MTTQTAYDDPNVSPSAEDRLRADLYRLLSRFLFAAPNKTELSSAAEMVGNDTQLGRAVTQFASACENANSDEINRQFHDLFIGVTRGELLPYSSYYLTGFLHEKPLAKLRRTMAELQVERSPDVSEPEDHIAALMEIMAGLIHGDFAENPTLDTQKNFFEDHIAPWADYFFTDLEQQSTSKLYACLGRVGRQFLAIEKEAFQMV